MKTKIIIPCFVYLLLSFVFVGLIKVINIDLSRFENIRNYYSIVSSISSTFVGITGLMLGLFYYFDNQYVEVFSAVPLG